MFNLASVLIVLIRGEAVMTGLEFILGLHVRLWGVGSGSSM